MKKKPKIVIIIIGSIKNDPAVPNIIHKTIHHFHNNKKINTVLCLPLEQNRTITDHTKKLKENYKIIKDFIDAHPEYFNRRNKQKLKTISKENQAKLLEEMNALYKDSEDPGFFDYINKKTIADVLSHEHNKQLFFLFNFVTHFNVPYLGVDDYSNLEFPLTNKEQITRLELIASHVIDQGIKSLNNSNGIIICEIENIYVLKLSIMISLQCQNLLNNEYDFKIVPSVVSSSYVREELLDTKASFEQFSADDPQYPLYQKNQSKIAYIPVYENSLDIQFSSTQFVNLIANITANFEDS